MAEDATRRARDLAQASVCATLAATDDGSGMTFEELTDQSQRFVRQAVSEMRSLGTAEVDRGIHSLTAADARRAGTPFRS